MAPTKTNTGHGALFDSFPQELRSLHGGAKFDEGFQLQPKDAPKGPTYDEFGSPVAASTAHGQVWDEWGWKEMPEVHGGAKFDEGFDSPSANAGSRGPLFDLFEPSTQVKYIYDGQDAEGIIDHVREDGVAMVTPRKGGNAVEVGLEQFLAYRSPSVDNATTTAPGSSAEAPSARSSDAHGGPRTAAPDPGQPVEPTPQGEHKDARTGEDADWSIVDHVKSLLSGHDVAKDLDSGKRWMSGAGREVKAGDSVSRLTHIGEKPLSGVVSKRFTRLGVDHVHVHVGNDHHVGVPAHELQHDQIAKTMRLPSELLKSHSEWGGVTSIAKEVTVAETAVQAQDGAAAFAGSKGAGSYCPECREKKSKLTDDGRCPDCNTALKAHDGSGAVPREKGDGNGSAESSEGKGVAEKTFDELRKAFGATGDTRAGGNVPGANGGVTWDGKEHSTGQQKGQAKSDPPDVPIDDRAHPDSDHHGNLSGVPTTCPHCGHVIAELDSKSEQGAPTHKCLEGFLDVVKSASIDVNDEVSTTNGAAGVVVAKRAHQSGVHEVDIRTAPDRFVRAAARNVSKAVLPADHPARNAGPLEQLKRSVAA